MIFRALVISSVLAVLSANAAAIGQPLEVRETVLNEIDQFAIGEVSHGRDRSLGAGKFLLRRTGSTGRQDLCADPPRPSRSQYWIVVDATDFGAVVKARSAKTRGAGKACQPKAESAPKRNSKFLVKPRQPRPAALVRMT